MSRSAAALRTQVPPRAPEGPLVEREAELAALADVLARVRASQGAMAAIKGLTGLGKTRLLIEACQLARQTEMEVLWARARGPERNFSLGVVRQLLEGRVVHSRGAERKRFFAGPAALAAPLMLEGLSPSRASRESEDPSSVAHGLYWLCSNLAAVRPMVLAVDDAECADEESLRFLLYLAERIRKLPVALIVTVGFGRPHPALVRELVSHPAARALRLEPLSRGAVAHHLRSRFRSADPAFTRAVHAASGGNPFVLDRLGAELARIRVRPTAQSVDVVHRLGPTSIAEAILLGLRHIGTGAVELARAVAVLGEAELRHAAELAELGPADAARVADALVRAGVFRHGQLLGFAQPAVRTALNLRASEWELAERRLRAAHILDREGTPPEKIAVHLVDARPARDARAVEVLCAAADRSLAKGAPDSAVRFLRRALREPPGAKVRARVLLKLGRAEAVAGGAEAVEHLREAARLIDEPVEQACTALEIGQLLYSLGRPEEAACALEHGLADLNGANAQLALRLRAARAVVTGRSLSQEESESVAARNEPQGSVDAATPDGLPPAHLAYERALRGEDASGVRGLARRALANEGLLENGTALEAERGPLSLDLHRSIAALVIVDDLQIAELALNAAVERARARGSVFDYANACYLRAWALLRQGRIDDAAADAHTTLAAARHGWRMALPGVHAVLAEAAIERGDLADTERHIALGGSEHRPVEESLPFYLVATGRTRLVQGRPSEALDAYLECGRRLIERGATGPGIVGWRHGAAAAHHQLGNDREPGLLLREELERARSFGVPGSIGRALHAMGTSVGGDDGLDHLSEAVHVLEHSEAALDYARALVDLGGALRRAGKRRESRDPLRLGLERADRCGARALSERARAEIAAGGGRPRRTALTGLEALTPRERQVAGLAAQGMSNREIAKALFVTIKTVEWHLRHAYEKVEVPSRRELRALVAASDTGLLEV